MRAMFVALDLRWLMRAMFVALGALSTQAALAQPPANAVWPDYQIIEWQPRGAAQLPALKQLGVSAAMVPSDRTDDPAVIVRGAAPLLASGMSCYVENIATDFYSPYHRWSPGHAVNWRFAEAQRAYQRDPADLAPLMREPSLSDPVWLHRIEDRLAALVRGTSGEHVLFYNLGDETGIADLAAFWDSDFSPKSLAGFRVWLQTQYPSLEVLNQEWGSHFAGWDQVVPRTTREAMQVPGENYAPWADFKTWMDAAFAQAVAAGTRAVHRANPSALAAIEGAQVPGWGGYDYTRLAHAVDVMELYDYGENLPILRSLNQAVVPLTTAFGAGRPQLHTIWREWTRGARGLILWDSKGEVVRADGSLGPSGRAYAPIFAELRGQLGTTLLASRPAYDPVAILYSPASFRIEWMIENRPKGGAWMHSSAEADGQGNATREALAGYASSLTHLGLNPRFITPDQLARGEFGETKALILPRSVALSAGELQTLRAFAAAGGLVLADAEPGGFDGHGRRRGSLPLHDLFAAGRAMLLPEDDRAGLAAALARARVAPRFAVNASDVETHLYAGDGATILVLQRDLPETDTDEQIEVALPRPMEALDLRTGHPLGQIKALSLPLGPIAPAVIALSDAARH